MMENKASAPMPVGRKYCSSDPVKDQGILKSLTTKERTASKQWLEKWSFYKKIPQYRLEEAIKLGMSEHEYRTAIESLNCQPEPKQYPVQVKPSPAPLPLTSSGVIGRRAQCPLESCGREVRACPVRPAPRDPLYDPYKQTIIFLGIDCGDPISYKLPPLKCEVPDHMMNRPLRPDVMPLTCLANYF